MTIEDQRDVVFVAAGGGHGGHDGGGQVFDRRGLAAVNGRRGLGDPGVQGAAAPFHQPVGIQQQGGPGGYRTARLGPHNPRPHGERERTAAIEQLSAPVGQGQDAGRMTSTAIGQLAVVAVEDAAEDRAADGAGDEGSEAVHGGSYRAAKPAGSRDGPRMARCRARAVSRC